MMVSSYSHTNNELALFSIFSCLAPDWRQIVVACHSITTRRNKRRYWHQWWSAKFDISMSTNYEDLSPSPGWPRWNFPNIFGVRKLPGLLYVCHCSCDPRFSHLSRTPTCDKWTDRRTHDDSKYCASSVMRV